MILIHLCCRIWILWEIQNSKHSSQSFITISCHSFPIISHTSTYISSQPRAAGAHQHPATYQHTTHLHSLIPRAAGAVAKLFTPSFWFGVCFQFPVSSFQFPVSNFQFPVSSFMNECMNVRMGCMNVWVYDISSSQSVFQCPDILCLMTLTLSPLQEARLKTARDAAARVKQTQLKNSTVQFSADNMSAVFSSNHFTLYRNH